MLSVLVPAATVHSSVAPPAGVLALYVFVPVPCVVPKDVSEAVAISANSVHDDPFQISVCAFPGWPANFKAAVTVPAAPFLKTAVFTLAISVQLLPFHCSTFAVTG